MSGASAPTVPSTTPAADSSRLPPRCPTFGGGSHEQSGKSRHHPTGVPTHVAVKIRLKRLGKIRSPHYRIVVADSRTKRDGRAIEEIGKYHPKNDPSVIEVNSERAQYWLSVGAQPTRGRRRPVQAHRRLAEVLRRHLPVRRRSRRRRRRTSSTPSTPRWPRPAASRATAADLRRQEGRRAGRRRGRGHPGRGPAGRRRRSGRRCGYAARPEVLADALEHLVRGIVAIRTTSRCGTRTCAAAGCSRCGSTPRTSAR